LIRGAVLAVCLGLAGGVHAEPLAARGTVEALFAPGDDAGARVVAVIAEAKRQILVHAYTFTHRAIAEALVAARRRGVDVRVVADREQADKVETSLLGWLAERDVPVYLDGQHAAAHNKAMVVDADLDTATLITGSFNFTHSAQYRNAENLLILRGHPELAARYAEDWRRHRGHALAMRK
jgi:phosphatidylserine/phosphatidylglycerophosphate/cardiolipin synthase-like enzyme